MKKCFTQKQSALVLGVSKGTANSDEDVLNVSHEVEDEYEAEA